MSEKYADLNETELIELCRLKGLSIAHRGLGEKTLIGLLDGTVQEEDCTQDPIDEDRDLMLYMQHEYPDQTFGQLHCGDEGYFCPNCPPGRAVACTVVDFEPTLRKDITNEMALQRLRLLR
jgi:hypothetical protein